jgi:GNAT superfamily N-acetyltransferase
MRESDMDWCAFCWLDSHSNAPESRRMKADRDVVAKRRYWAGQEPVVQRLLATKRVMVAEADVDGVAVLLGFICYEDEPDETPVIHFLLTHRKFQRLGIARDLLGDFRGRECFFTHWPSEKSVPLPRLWAYDPYLALR